MNAIEISNLTKTYKSFSMENFSLEIPCGTILGLVGENGAGKSTLIKLIMNSIKADFGEVFIFGKNNSSSDFYEIKQDIGVVLDDAHFGNSLNAKNINTIMKNTYKRHNEAKFFELLEKFGLDKKKKFKDYSRGMRMKLSLVVALSHDAKLLILDEATAGLDPIIRDEILDVLNEFTRDENHTVLISSHITSDLEKICDNIAFIHKGKLILHEEKDKILEEYAMLKLSEKEYADIPKNAIFKSIKKSYGYDILAYKDKINSSHKSELYTLEDVILFIVKEEK